MATRINWKTAGATLHQFYDELADATDNWPTPCPDGSVTASGNRRIAQKHWCERIRATYVTLARCNIWFQDLMALGAPLELLSGASFATEKLTRQLAMLAHLVRPFDPKTSPTVSEKTLDGDRGEPSWPEVFERSVELFVFNLSLSHPAYEAVAAVCAEPAISRLAAMLAAGTEKTARFGHAALRWMVRVLPEEIRRPTRCRLPRLMAAYESLCHGSPELLNALAGDEITIELIPGNLGTLRDEQLAVIFYDTLGSTILPLLDDLGCEGTEAWQRHYRLSPTERTAPALVAAIAHRPR